MRPKMDKNGNIRKNEFIELALEAKLLDISERKTPAPEIPKEQKNVKKLNNLSSLKMHLQQYKSLLNFRLTFSSGKAKESKWEKTGIQ